LKMWKFLVSQHKVKIRFNFQKKIITEILDCKINIKELGYGK
jgi:hypothetical protein